jgi:murein L,D-transpeptidase YafK
MKVLLYTLLFSVYLYSDLIQTYRLNGLKSVEREINAIMQTSTYWKSFLKNKDVRYGYYESINSILICNKNKKTLELYNIKNNRFIKNFKSNVFVGEKKGAKQKEGDSKTPIGVYKLTNKLTRLDPFYGPIALVTSYPNKYDKIKNKSGQGIWIHGLPYNQKRDKFTKGCIALDNKQIKSLDLKFNYKKSLFLISENKLKTASKENISNILAQIYRWKNAWETNDINKYLSYYNINFKKNKNINLEKFSKRKIRIFNKNENKKIIFKNINISPYPNNENKLLFKITMYENYKAPYYKFKGNKELYVELKENGKISILLED